MTRVALVHDFFVAEGGAEQVALELARLLPTADVHTSFFDVRRFGDRLDPARVMTWPLQRVFGPTERFRSFLPLYPAWFGRLDLRAYDLVVSSSIAFTHAVRTRPNALHLSYVYTPMRYAWSLDAYLDRSSWSHGPCGRPSADGTGQQPAARTSSSRSRRRYGSASGAVGAASPRFSTRPST